MLDAESPRLALPPVPADQIEQGVAVWEEALTIESYLPEEADPYPSYLDSRVYQGSSGRVFPLPFIERVESTRSPRLWKAIHIENEWVRVVVLPELGGRIHIGYDKVADYDFFYRNNVIKPALVGLAGPWISGGVEFNWPQHHRPGTFLPTDVEIERHDDGSVTVWCSDHDPFARMKGMHGIHLRPDSSAIEARVRLYNRSDTMQTFLWWANVAARVGDDYQSNFPADVGYVADHAKRAVTAFPHADRPYYGIDYPSRANADNPDGDRLDWYRNIPVPTSYMVTETDEEFFGGYDHSREAGFVHWAPRDVSPGKKQWTWGNAPFGWAWDGNLTDGDGPYVELMAGVFTDNQPDFAWIAPGETKTFSQFWYPVRKTGLVTAASRYAAARLEPHGDDVRIVLCPAVRETDANLLVRSEDGRVLLDRRLDLDPGTTIELSFTTPDLELELQGAAGVLLTATTARRPPHPEPAAAQEPPEPSDIESIDELHTIATYLHQYRHATRSPEMYWEEALRRDPGDTRSHTALGASEYRRGRFEKAHQHLSAAVSRATQWAPTPRDAEPLYLLGLVEDRRGNPERAQNLLARASWDERWRDASLFALARLRARNGNRHAAIETLSDRLTLRADHHQARCLLAALLIADDDSAAAAGILTEVLTRDPLDQWARHLAGESITTDGPTMLDIALEYAAAGLFDRALELLDRADSAPPVAGQVEIRPLAAYHRAAILDQIEHSAEARDERERARGLDVRHAQALRLDDVRALELALSADPTDPVAALLLGNWYYDRRRPEDAIGVWQVAARAEDPTISVIALRNLGLAAYNVDHDRLGALTAYEAARDLAPEDAKLLYEYDQLRARLGHPASERLRLLDDKFSVVQRRDDLMICYVELLVAAGRVAEAYQILISRHFQPWEGGEGQVLAAWDAVNLAQARTALADGDVSAAVVAAERSLRPPASLGEARHDLANAAELWVVLGDSLHADANTIDAHAAWEHAADDAGDFVRMSVTPFSARTYWSVIALRRLGRHDEADALEAGLRTWLDLHAERAPQIDFFATSLPSMLLFSPDLVGERDTEVAEIRKQLDALDESDRQHVALGRDVG